MLIDLQHQPASAASTASDDRARDDGGVCLPPVVTAPQGTASKIWPPANLNELLECSELALDQDLGYLETLMTPLKVQLKKQALSSCQASWNFSTIQLHSVKWQSQWGRSGCGHQKGGRSMLKSFVISRRF